MNNIFTIIVETSVKLIKQPVAKISSTLGWKVSSLP